MSNGPRVGVGVFLLNILTALFRLHAAHEAYPVLF